MLDYFLRYFYWFLGLITPFTKPPVIEEEPQILPYVDESEVVVEEPKDEVGEEIVIPDSDVTIPASTVSKMLETLDSKAIVADEAKNDAVLEKMVEPDSDVTTLASIVTTLKVKEVVCEESKDAVLEKMDKLDSDVIILTSTVCETLESKEIVVEEAKNDAVLEKMVELDSDVTTLASIVTTLDSKEVVCEESKDTVLEKMDELDSDVTILTSTVSETLYSKEIVVEEAKNDAVLEKVVEPDSDVTIPATTVNSKESVVEEGTDEVAEKTVEPASDMTTPVESTVVPVNNDNTELPEDLTQIGVTCIDMSSEDLATLITRLKEGLEVSKAAKNHSRSQDIRELIWKVNDLLALGVRGIKELENKSVYQHQKDMKKNKYNKPRIQRKWQQPESWRDNLPIPGGYEQNDNHGQQRNNKRNNKRNNRTRRGRGFSGSQGGQNRLVPEQDPNFIAKALVDQIIFNSLAILNQSALHPPNSSKSSPDAKPYTTPKCPPAEPVIDPHDQTTTITTTTNPSQMSIIEKSHNYGTKDTRLVDIAISLVNDIIASSIQMIIKETSCAASYKPDNRFITEGRANLSLLEAELLADVLDHAETCDSIYHDVIGVIVKREPNMGG